MVLQGSDGKRAIVEQVFDKSGTIPLKTIVIKFIQRKIIRLTKGELFPKIIFYVETCQVLQKAANENKTEKIKVCATTETLEALFGLGVVVDSEVLDDPLSSSSANGGSLCVSLSTFWLMFS